MSPSVDMLVRTAKDIGALVRQRRRELGLDQRTLARRAGVSRQWIVEVEAGKPRAELALVLKTLDTLGVRLQTDDRTPSGRVRRPGVRVPDIDAVVRAARRRP